MSTRNRIMLSSSSTSWIFFPLDQILQKNGGIDSLEIIIPDFLCFDGRQIGKATPAVIRPPCPFCVFSCQFPVFPEGQGQHLDFHKPAAEQSGQFAGQQPGIGSGNVQIHLGTDVQRIYGFLEIFHQLDLIQEYVVHFPRLQPFHNECMKLVIVQQKWENQKFLTWKLKTFDFPVFFIFNLKNFQSRIFSGRKSR